MPKRAPVLVVPLMAVVGCAASAGGTTDAAPENTPAMDGAPRNDLARELLADARTADAAALIAGCPGPDAHVGDPAWRETLVVPPSFQQCAYWVESDGTLDRSSTTIRLKETLARKVIVSVAAGTYRLSDAPGQAPFGLPICLVHPGRPRLATATGTINRRMQGPVRIFDVSLPLPGLGLVKGALVREGSGPLSIGDLRGLQLCVDTSCAPLTVAFFDDCAYEGAPARDVVQLKDGTVELEMVYRRGGVGVGTEAGYFARAAGSFRGVAFDQRDYFKLIYSPEHHHFVRHYAVLFDAPIGGACGLELVNLPGPPPVNSRPVKAFAVDCQLGRQRELDVTAVTAL